MGTRRPNVVFIVTDNQSPWTMGCYGNDEILTPNLDRLAAQGTRFANAYCVNPVCSPNRATNLTGLIPSQHGVHNWLGQEKPSAQMGPDAYCTIREFSNLPQLLADADYECGLSGKWHLGDSLHPQLGFTYWFTKPYGHTGSFYNSEAIWNGTVYTEPRYMTDVIAEHAEDFLRNTRLPFFLYVGFNGPYGLDQDLRRVHRNRWTEYYADKELRCFPREEVHPWLVNNRDVINNVQAMRNYAAAVSGVDDGVGRILETLASLGLAEDTLVVFTADHGLSGGHHGFWGMGDHSRPLHMFDPHLNVPLLFRHPTTVPAGAVCETMTCNYDLFPTLLDYLGIHAPEAAPAGLPGKSYAPVLRGEHCKPPEQEVVFHEYENTRTVRTRTWKLTRRRPVGPDELYNLIEDPGERTNRIDDPAAAEARDDLDARLTRFFETFADPQYDLWRGGRSKAGLMLDVKPG
ncbi:MAG: sulfatase-like hydrolase/transferase [Kiritimatiellaeota bacterium]|nr:sulfatase-like hydrolase/transferase [Kiritimatiellota bacterium]